MDASERICALSCIEIDGHKCHGKYGLRYFKVSCSNDKDYFYPASYGLHRVVEELRSMGIDCSEIDHRRK